MATTTHIRFGKAAMLLMAASTLGSCSLMHEDMEPCPQGADLHFVYNYNMQRADMFNDHVGGVTAYVFDDNGTYLFKQEENNTAASAPLKNKAYAMHLSIAPGNYRVIALANQKGYDETLATAGAKYRRQTPATGEKMEKMQVTLDRLAGGEVSADASLDTLWHGMDAVPFTVRENETTHDTISLMRDMKMLTIGLHNVDEEEKADITADDFDIYIKSNNGILNYDNSLHEDETLTYRPYALWDTEFRDTEGNVTERTAHAELTFNRLMYYGVAENDKNAVLTIYNKKTQKTVAVINLPDCLAQGRNAYAHYNYSPQEYLDREYDYHLDFFLQGDTWKEVMITISVLNWSHRYQNESL